MGSARRVLFGSSFLVLGLIAAGVFDSSALAASQAWHASQGLQGSRGSQAVQAVQAPERQGSSVKMPSSTPSSVTVYGADWCGACKVLERGLKERDIPFDVVDVDRNPDAHARARSATGTSAIPVTNVVRSGDGTWIVGANVPAVERAYRGN